MGRLAASVIAVLLFAPPALGADAGVVKGTFTVGGKSYTPDHIYALSVPNTLDKTKDDVRVIVSVGPQSDRILLYLGMGAGTSVTVAIGPGGGAEPGIGFRYANGSIPQDIGDAKPVTMTMSWGGLRGVKYESKVFDPGTNGRVSGKLTIPPDPKDSGNPARAKVAFTAELEFDVPIVGRIEK